MTAPATEAPSSPWWYRRRGSLIAVLYFAAFLAGSYTWELGGKPKLPFFRWAGDALGPHGAAIVVWAAAFLLVACWAIRVWGSSYLSAAVVWNPDARTDSLLVDGPFRYLRNPLYFGNLLMALGIGVLGSPCAFGLVVLANAVFLHLLASYESRGLRARFGQVYDAYARAVPALVPRLSPAHVEGTVGGKPSLRQGLRSEIFSAALAIAMIYVAAGGRYGLAAFIMLFVAGWVLQRLAARA